MTSFDNRTIDVLPLLTVIVLLEQGDMDYTMVDWWDCHSALIGELPVHMKGGFAQATLRSRYLQGPGKHTSCFACCARMWSFSSEESARKSALVSAVKSGALQIERAYLRTELTHCSRCGSKKPTKVVNGEWLKALSE